MRRQIAKWAMIVGLAQLGGASASSVIQSDLTELTATADVVIRGTVKGLQSRWTSDHRQIVTDIEIAVAESLKGAPETTVIVQQAGGVVGDIAQKVSGLASFQPNEEVVLFLEKRGTKYEVVGLSQGKYRIDRSSDGRRAFAVPSTTDAQLVDRTTNQPVEPRVEPMALETLRARVKEAVQLKGKQQRP